MKKTIKAILIIIAIVCAALIIMTVISRTVFHRSLSATIVSIGIRIGNNGETESSENAKIAMEKRAEVEDEPLAFDPNLYESKSEVIDFNGRQVITFGDDNKADSIVLYLHGGAYINEINAVHLGFIDKMVKNTGAYVVAPVYPLAPNHTYEETYEMLDQLYPAIREDGRRLTIMGDSAGGGLALSYCEYLKEIGEELPDQIIVFSPWVDVSMTENDHTPYEEKDPMLKTEGCIEMGKAWAGSTDTKDYMVSPLFGDTTGFPKTTIYVGTNEILYPDILQMNEKMKLEGVDVTLIIGEGMNHIYPLFPLATESADAADQVFKLVKN